MEPWLGTNDKSMFYKYLNKSTTYFEYGSGGSTNQAAIRKNITKIYKYNITNKTKNQYLIKQKYSLKLRKSQINLEPWFPLKRRE